MDKKSQKSMRSWLAIALIASMFVLLYRMSPSGEMIRELTQVEFFRALDGGEIEEPIVRFIDREDGETFLKGKMRVKTEERAGEEKDVGVAFRVRLVPGENESLMNELLVRGRQVKVEERRPAISPFLMQIIFFVLMLGL